MNVQEKVDKFLIWAYLNILIWIIIIIIDIKNTFVIKYINMINYFKKIVTRKY